jgi:hypothetical protein
MNDTIAKTLLIRWAYSQDLKTYKPATREFVYTVDVNRVYIGTSEGPKQLAYTDDIDIKISAALDSYKFKVATDSQLASTLLPGQAAFNTDIQRIQFLNPLTNTRQTYVTKQDLPLKEAFTIVIQDDHIDTDDNNSVTISGFKRPIVLVFVNGRLCTNNPNDPHQYVYDEARSTLKIYNMSSGDLVAYF